MDIRAIRDWIGTNRELINVGILAGTTAYTFITAWILRATIRQTRLTVEPTLTMTKGSTANNRSSGTPYVNFNTFKLQNVGNGTALEVVTNVMVHSEAAPALIPRFDTKVTIHPHALRVGDLLLFSDFHSAVNFSIGTEGESLFNQVREFEFFVTHRSILGVKYLTHLSVSMAGHIESLYVGKYSVIRLIQVRLGILWRFYRQQATIWRKVKRR